MHASPGPGLLLLFILFFAEHRPPPNDSGTEWVIIQTSRVANHRRRCYRPASLVQRRVNSVKRNDGREKRGKAEGARAAGASELYIGKQSHTRDKVGGSKLQLYRG